MVVLVEKRKKKGTGLCEMWTVQQWAVECGVLLCAWWLVRAEMCDACKGAPWETLKW